MTLHHPAFDFIKQQHVESLNLNVQEFSHKLTGAQHVHLQADSDENVFLVALRTVPHDSTGVAHILEHTALCGSRSYPVRDPFFMMTRRSLNTFMNAFTSSDWTAYPFASLNKKDFNNLLDVYLDAVFFSRLDELDFAQEGHRLEFDQPNDPTSPLMFKGVVYNEMKGAMSSVPSQLWHTLGKYLFPTTTYHHNSGGDPECIPDLTYQQLLDFYKTHYHPSNAIFMTFGDISAKDHQTKFEDQALKHFEKLDYTVSVEDEKRYFAPVRVQESYANNDEDIEQKTHVVMGWLLGQSTNLEQSLEAQLLSSILLDNSATPLMKALETSDLGNAPSPLCGLEDSQKELIFVCGLAGCKDHVSDQVESLILSTLTQVAEEGIPKEDVESALHQLELHQREIGGDSYPYGLQLILTALGNATHRGDPVKLLDVDNALNELRKKIQSPDFVKQLAKRLLVENQHRVRLTLTPDAELNQRKEQAELSRLQSINESLSDNQKQQIIELAAALKERQAQEDDESILPKVTLDDVPKSGMEVHPDSTSINNTSIHRYSAGTNGLVYQQAIFTIPDLPEQLVSLLPIYSNVVTELGIGDLTYLDTQRLQASVSGGFSAFSSIRGSVDDEHAINSYFTFSAKALNRNHNELTKLMAKTLAEVRFDEHSRMQELIAQIVMHNEQRVTGNGHVLAMAAASAGNCASAKLHHQLNGLAGQQTIKALNNSINNADALTELAENLRQLHSAIVSSERQILLISEAEHLQSFSDTTSTLCAAASSNNVFTLPRHQQHINQAWLTSSQVNFCAKSYSTVPVGHPDAAALVILGGFLRNGFLHTAIREQGGAYGGGASQDSNIAAFKFYSYRDPRMKETLEDFDQSINWLLNETHTAQSLEEAILGVVSSLDKSESPAGRAKRCFHADLHGRTSEQRQVFRERILQTSIDDLKRVAEHYFVDKPCSTAIITDHSNKADAQSLNLDIHEL